MVILGIYKELKLLKGFIYENEKAVQKILKKFIKYCYLSQAIDVKERTIAIINGDEWQKIKTLVLNNCEEIENIFSNI